MIRTVKMNIMASAPQPDFEKIQTTYKHIANKEKLVENKILSFPRDDFSNEPAVFTIHVGVLSLVVVTGIAMWGMIFYFVDLIVKTIFS